MWTIPGLVCMLLTVYSVINLNWILRAMYGLPNWGQMSQWAVESGDWQSHVCHPQVSRVSFYVSWWSKWVSVICGVFLALWVHLCNHAKLGINSFTQETRQSPGKSTLILQERLGNVDFNIFTLVLPVRVTHIWKGNMQHKAMKTFCVSGLLAVNFQDGHRLLTAVMMPLKTMRSLASWPFLQVLIALACWNNEKLNCTQSNGVQAWRRM